MQSSSTTNIMYLHCIQSLRKDCIDRTIHCHYLCLLYYKINRLTFELQQSHITYAASLFVDRTKKKECTAKSVCCLYTMFCLYLYEEVFTFHTRMMQCMLSINKHIRDFNETKNQSKTLHRK